MCYFKVMIYQRVSTADGSLGQGSPSAVHCIQVGVAQVQLAANQNDGRPGTKVLDLREPHGADMAQGVGIGQREAQHHYIGPGGGELKDGKKSKVKNIVHGVVCVMCQFALFIKVICSSS